LHAEFVDLASSSPRKPGTAVAQKKTILFLAVALAAISLLVLWRARSERRNSADLVAPPAAIRATTREPAARLEEPLRESVAPVAESSAAEAVAEGSPTERVELVEESDSAVARLRRDPAFLEACARPADTDAQALIDLVAKAKEAINAQLSVEGQRRVDAGLGQRMEGYRSGEPLKTPAAPRDQYRSFFFMEAGEALQVDFPVAEYPELYALRDSVKLLEAEVGARR
jgi:hypothetical protein